MWSPIFSAVGESRELLAEINAINSQLPLARMWWANDMVMLASELDAGTLTLEQVATVCNVVGSTADRWGGAAEAVRREAVVPGRPAEHLTGVEPGLRRRS